MVFDCDLSYTPIESGSKTVLGLSLFLTSIYPTSSINPIPLIWSVPITWLCCSETHFDAVFLWFKRCSPCVNIFWVLGGVTLLRQPDPKQIFTQGEHRLTIGKRHQNGVLKHGFHPQKRVVFASDSGALMFRKWCEKWTTFWPRNWPKNGPKMGQKWVKNGPKMGYFDPFWGKNDPFWGQKMTHFMSI